MNRLEYEFIRHICLPAGFYLQTENKRGVRNPFPVARTAEDMIIGAIRSKFRDDSINIQLGNSLKGNSTFSWAVHALDGKANFSRGIPYFGVGISLIEGTDVVGGGIYVPSLNQFSYTGKGRGAWLNEERVHVSDVSEWKDSIGCLAPTVGSALGPLGAKLYSFGSECEFKIAPMGAGCGHAPAVSSGARDWWVTPDIPAYDIALVGALMIQEAGGRATNSKGDDFKLGHDILVASNGKLHDKLLSILRK